MVVVANFETFVTLPAMVKFFMAVIFTLTCMPVLMRKMSCSPTRAMNWSLLRSTILPMY
ncbi:hypothetical protein D3C80_2181630 [compost metagenome]